MTVTRMQCCGIIEINGIGGGRGPKENLLEALNTPVHTQIIHKCGWVVFSQAYRPTSIPSTYGTKFKEYLEEHKLGTIVQLEATLNKNSSNMIDVFMWKVDHDALAKWYRENSVPVPATTLYVNGTQSAEFAGAYVNALNQADLPGGLLNPNP